MITILKWCLNWIITHGGIRVFTSDAPFGKRLGGHDIAGVKDSYIILQFTKDSIPFWSGYWQTA